MKKSFILMGLLLILTMGAAVAVTAQIGKGAEDFPVTEKVLYGDRSAAEGLHAAWHSSCYNNKHLSWDTEYTIGEMTDSNTAFHFSPQKQASMYEQKAELELTFPVDVSLAIAGDDAFDASFFEDTSEPGCRAIGPMVMSVAQRGKNGEQYTEEVYLKDYLDYYPVSFEFNDWERSVWMPEEEDTPSRIQDWFQVPVREDHLMKVTVVKDSSGELVEFDVTTISGGLDAAVDWQVTEDGLYVLLTGNFPETGSIGSGIYYLPFYTPEGVESSQPVISIDSTCIKQMYAIQYEAGDAAPAIRISGTGQQILLYSQEADHMAMTAFDVNTGKELQKQEILEEADEIFVDMHEDFQAVFGQDSGRFIVLEQEEEGGYQERISSSIYEIDDLEDYLYYDNYTINLMSADYRNGKLALGMFTDTGANLIAVYDASGLAYLGCYGLETKDPSVLNGIGSSLVPGYKDKESFSLQWMEQES